MIKKYILLIKQLREQKNITLEEMSEIIGTTRQTYTAIEAGKSEPSFEGIKNICKYFNISLDTIVTGELENKEKYKEMILSFLRYGSGDGKITKTKLAKLLYIADFSWYYNNIKSMSGMSYRKIDYGPVPDMYFTILEEMIEDGKVELEIKKNESKEGNAFLIKEAKGNENQKLNLLNKEEIKRIKYIAEKWKNKNTKDIVNWTHNQLPYSICKINEIIPYSIIIQEDEDKIIAPK